MPQNITSACTMVAATAAATTTAAVTTKNGRWVLLLWCGGQKTTQSIRSAIQKHNLDTFRCRYCCRKHKRIDRYCCTWRLLVSYNLASTGFPRSVSSFNLAVYTDLVLSKPSSVYSLIMDGRANRDSAPKKKKKEKARAKIRNS